MEITFNPLIAAEADAVRRFLTPGDVQVRVAAILETVDKAAPYPVIAHEDRPDVGADVVVQAASAVPLPPPVPSAPSTVAADLFPTAPAVPQAGIPLPPGAALPPVPPVPAAPPAPPAPAAPTNRADVDSAGLPWDARIHSESRNKVADGTWRKRRNTAPEVVAQVEAELRALMAIPAPGAAIPTPPAPVTVVPAGPGAKAIIIDPSASPASAVTPPVPAPPVPQPPAAAPTPVAPPPVAQDTAAAPAEPITFAGVMRQVTEGLTQHKFTEQTVNECLREAAGGADIKIGMLAARPDLCVAFSNLLRAKSAA